jgi:uncharacterized membrane protein
MNIQMNNKDPKDIDFNLFNDLNTTILINENVEKNGVNDLNTLLSMGFDEKMIKKVYVLLKPNNIDEAIYLLTDDKGIYHHYFIERHGREDECFICGLKSENHQNFLPNGKQRTKSIKDNTTKSKIELTDIRNEPLIESDEGDTLEPSSDYDIDDEELKNIQNCNVCAGDLTNKDKKNNYLPCKHFFCSDCYLNYLKNEIEKNAVDSIKCMEKDCPQELDEKFISSHLNGDKSLLDKYHKFKKRNKISQNPDLVICPEENCDSYAKKEKDNKFVKCLNGHKFCSECKKPWHGNKECIPDIDRDLMGKYHLKKCPKCKAMTEKNMGCNHMKCNNCHCNWCWFCEKIFDSEKEHFGVNGPCAKLQFTRSEIYNNCCCLFLYKCWICFMHFMLLLFIIPSITSAYMLRKVKDSFNEEEKFKKIKRFEYFLCIFILCVIPYLLLFLGCGFPFFLICLIPSLRRKVIIYILDLNDRE